MNQMQAEVGLGLSVPSAVRLMRRPRNRGLTPLDTTERASVIRRSHLRSGAPEVHRLLAESGPRVPEGTSESSLNESTAQSFGITAARQGLNIYVCGSSWIRRHDGDEAAGFAGGDRGYCSRPC